MDFRHLRIICLPVDLAPVPGFAPSAKQLRTRGIAVVAVIAVILLTVWAYNEYKPRDRFSVTLRTPVVAAGIVEGAKVRIQGVEVGNVSGIERLGNGQQGVTLSLDGPQGRSLTNNVEAAFSAGNLFGVSEVVLTPHDGGGPLASGAVIAPTKPISDNTVSNMITTIGDVNDDALRPNMSQLLLNFDASSKAMLPLFTALGSVTQAISDTQKLSTAATFPLITETIQSADSAVAAMLPGFQIQSKLPLLHNGNSQKIKPMLDQGINDERTGLLAGLQRILTPEALDALRTLTPAGVSLMQPILNAFPNGSASGVGIQFGQLLDNVRRAMPDGPNGPTLNLRLQVYYPAVSAALPPEATASPAAKPGDKPAARPKP
ncbi:MlaD family protein [Tsukamurella strandjordii]